MHSNVLTFCAVIVYLTCCTACVQIVEEHRGYKFSASARDKVHVGQTQSDFMTLMGSPTVVSGFDKNTWYYISVDTRSLARQNPKSMHCKTLAVHWQGGHVEKVEWKDFDENLSHIQYVEPQDLRNFQMLVLLEKTMESIQPTPVKPG